MYGKNLILEKMGKKGKSGWSIWGNRVQNGRLRIDHIFGSSINLSRNVLDMKRIKTNEFCDINAHSCLIRPYLVPKYAVFKIFRIRFIRF